MIWREHREVSKQHQKDIPVFLRDFFTALSRKVFAKAVRNEGISFQVDKDLKGGGKPEMENRPVPKRLLRASAQSLPTVLAMWT